MDDNFYTYIKSDDAVFHYTNMRNGIEGILESNTLKLSPLSKTDDPQEYNHWNFGLIGWSLPEETIVEKWTEASYEMNKFIKKKSFITCFCVNTKETQKGEWDSENKEIIKYGFSRSRMWAQYGDHHKGMCFVFSKRELINFVNNCEKLAKVGEVNYVTENRLDYNAITINGNIIDDFNIKYAIQDHIHKNFDTIFLTKNTDYRDESEYRMIVIDNDKNREYIDLDIAPILKGIIVGDRFPKVYLPAIKELAKGYEIRKIKWNSGELIPILIENPT